MSSFQSKGYFLKFHILKTFLNQNRKSMDTLTEELKLKLTLLEEKEKKRKEYQREYGKKYRQDKKEYYKEKSRTYYRIKNEIPLELPVDYRKKKTETSTEPIIE
jgi:uncharacterized protein YbaR (Trm112 family)